MNRFIKNSYYALASNVISKFFGLLTLGIVSRTLDSQNFGNYSAVQNAAMSGNMIGSLGIPTVLQIKSANFSNTSRDDLSAVVSNCILTYIAANAIICGLLFAFPAIFTEYLVNSSMDVRYNIFLVIILLLSAVNQIPLYFLMGVGAFREYATHITKVNFITLVCTILFIYFFEKTLQSGLMALVFSSLITVGFTAILFFKMMKLHNLSFYIKPSLRQIQAILGTGFMYYIGNTLLVSVSGIVTISLFYQYLSSTEYGFLRISTAFTALLGVLPGSLQLVNLSNIFLEGDQNKLMSIQFRLIPFATIILIIMILTNISPLISLIFSEEYAKGSNFVLLMVLLQIPTIYLSILSNYITANGFLTYVGLVSVVGTIVFMSMMHMLIPQMKLEGYFYAMLLSIVISLLITVAKVMKTDYHFVKSDFFASVLNIIVIILLVAILNFTFSYKILLTISLVLFYTSCFYFLCLEQTEKEAVKIFIWQR